MPILGTIASSYNTVSGAFESIASVVATSGTSTVTFSSIPSTYKHLQLRSAQLGGGSTIQLNNVTAAVYARAYVYTSGTNVLSGDNINQSFMAMLNYSSTNPAVNILDIHDYAATDKRKTLYSLTGASNEIAIYTGFFNNNNAISTITIGSGSIAAGSVFALYGIKGS